MDATDETESSVERPAAEDPATGQPAAQEPVRDVHWLVPLALLIGATFLLGVAWGTAANIVGALLGVTGLVASGVLALRARAAGSASMFMPVMVGVAAAVMVVAQLLKWL